MVMMVLVMIVMIMILIMVLMMMIMMMIMIWQVGALPAGALVEIELVAVSGQLETTYVSEE